MNGSINIEFVTAIEFADDVLNLSKTSPQYLRFNKAALQNTENNAILLFPRDIQMLRSFQFQVGFALTHWQGVLPWTPLWVLPSDLRYRIVLRARFSLIPGSAP